MAVRAGMSNLIQRVRALTGAGTADWTAGTVVYWTDQQIQDTLDSNSRYFVAQPLSWLPQNISGTLNYLIAQAPYQDLEELASGTTRWNVATGAGSAIGTANYTPDYRSGEISFGTVNQAGSAYYLTGYTYDVHAAAADIWDERLTNFTTWYEFRADNQTFKRGEAWDHAWKMRDYHRGKAGANIVAQAFGDLRTGEFIRVDLNDGCRW